MSILRYRPLWCARVDGVSCAFERQPSRVCAGEWQYQQDWVVFEKPKGLFEATLYFSAQLQLPSGESSAEDGDVKLRLVKGIVQSGEPVKGTSAGENSSNETRCALASA